MKELTKYKCDYCGTEYKNKSDAQQCESNHKVDAQISKCHWLNYTQDHSGYPQKVYVKFENGNIIEYKR